MRSTPVQKGGTEKIYLAHAGWQVCLSTVLSKLLKGLTFKIPKLASEVPSNEVK
jgi:hypothetical protein